MTVTVTVTVTQRHGAAADKANQRASVISMDQTSLGEQRTSTNRSHTLDQIEQIARQTRPSRIGAEPRRAQSNCPADQTDRTARELSLLRATSVSGRQKALEFRAAALFVQRWLHDWLSERS